MDKKKAVKLATASAVAASAFVAANPHASQAATDVATVVSQAKAQFKAAYYAYSHTVTETGKLPNISDVYAAYNKAKQAYANAVAVVNKAGGAKKDAYLADLQATYETYVFKANPKSGEARVATYIDAYNYAVKLDGLRQDLAKAVEAKDLKKAEELYHKISYELKTRTVILDRVYGQSTRELLRSQFKAEAQKLRDSLIYDITVAMKAREAQDAVKAGNLDKAKAALDQVNQYVSKVTDAFKAELQKAAQDANAAYEAALTPKVESVSAINAKELVVKFNKAIDKDTVLDASGNIVANVFFVNGVAVTGTGSLSEDGKTLTITKSTGTWEGTYLFEVKKDTVKTTDGKSVEAFAEKISYEDTVAPTYTGITRVNASKVKVNFSEPIKDRGTITAKLADGTDLSAVVLTSIDGNSILFDLSNATIPSGKDIAVTISGVMDYSDNLVNPNPVTVTIQKGAKDGVQPDVASITPINAKKFEIKFTEEIEGLDIGEITVNGVALAAPSKVTQDKTDKTKYIVELANPVQGLVTIGVSGGPNTYTDLSGEDGKSASRIVDFKTDTTKPTLTSATVTKDRNGAEILTFTLSEDVTFEGSGTIILAAKRVKDYVTETGNITFAAADLTAVSGTSNQFSIPLSKVKYNGAALDTGASYTVDLAANLFKDTAGNLNDAKSSAFSFTRGTDADTTKPTIVTSYDSSESNPQVANNGILVVDKNTLKVKFAGDIDGATATNKANYYVSGATVDSVTLLPNNEVEIKLAADSNTYTGLRTVKISGVKTKSGNTMDEYTTTEYLVENVRPTVTGVQLTSIVADDDAATPGDQPATYVTLTFSENVNVGAVNAADFDLYIKGNKVTTATVTTTAGSSPNKVVVKLAGVALTGQDIADGVELKAQSNIDIADVNGNIANIPAPIKVTLQ